MSSLHAKYCTMPKKRLVLMLEHMGQNADFRFILFQVKFSVYFSFFGVQTTNARYHPKEPNKISRKIVPRKNGEAYW